MLTQDYLSLHLNHLRRHQEWSRSADGLDFIFPNRGEGQYVAVSGTRSFGPGCVLVTNGAVGGKLGASNGGEFVFWSFSVQLQHLFPLFAAHEICLLDAIQSRLKDPLLYPAANPVARECHRLLAEVPAEFNLDHRGQLLRVAAAVLSQELSSSRLAQCSLLRPDEHLKAVLEHLSFDEIINLPVDELAQRFNCSRRHLNRLFHQHLGFSVTAFRMEIRLLKAVSLLRDPNAKVINVAEQCGFNHLGLFNTCFKRRFGASPGHWRKGQPVPSSQGNRDSQRQSSVEPVSGVSASEAFTVALALDSAAVGDGSQWRTAKKNPDLQLIQISGRRRRP